MKSDGEIVRRHGPMVWKTIWRLVGGIGRDADAADCFQEVFLAALEAGRREEVRNWEAMLRRIATAKGLDMLRTRIRRRGREAARPEWEELADRIEPPGASLEHAELAGELREALARLWAEEAELFCLRHLEEMSYEQIGEAMGMTTSAVGVGLHRVKEKLRGWLTAGKIASEDEVRSE